MIITRTPFRISFCGGGSDLPAFYRKHGGCVLSTGIDKYMYISIHPSFCQEEIILKYSKTEIVRDISEIEHKYFKAILLERDIHGIEITSTADVPAGTGLGSSSSFTVGLLHNLFSYQGEFVSKDKLAKEACRIEIGQLKQPVGKQDQYAAAYGGMNFYTFNKDNSVFVEPIMMPEDARNNLQKNLMMFYLGNVRSASDILSKQSDNVQKGKAEYIQLQICELTYKLREYLQCGNIDRMGEILDCGWRLKKELAEGITSPLIDRYYDMALHNGALGGKLLGAGGGGFLLLYVPAEKQGALRKKLALPQLPFQFDLQGSTIIYVGSKTHTVL